MRYGLKKVILSMTVSTDTSRLNHIYGIIKNRLEMKLQKFSLLRRGSIIVKKIKAIEEAKKPKQNKTKKTQSPTILK